MNSLRRKIGLIIFAGIAVLIPAVRSTLFSFLLAFFLAACMQRPILFCTRRHIPRAISAVSLLLLVLIPAGGFIIYAAVRTAGRIRTALDTITPLLGEGTPLDMAVYSLITSLPPDVKQLAFAAIEALNNQKDTILAQIIGKLGTVSTTWIASFPGRLASTGVFLLFFLFCAVGYPQLVQLIKSLLPSDWLNAFTRLQRDLKCRFIDWWAGELCLMGIIFGELFLGLLLLRRGNFLWAGAFIALIDLIPLVGSGLILVPWAVLCLIGGEHLCAAGLFILWVCVWLTRTLLEPKLVGARLQLPSAVSLLSAILGVRLFGLKGLILFPVFTAVAIGLFQNEKRTSP